MALRQIAYVSASRGSAEAEEVRAILSSSRRNNLRDHITGLLLAGPRGFIQLVEGPRSSIAQLYTRIAVDPRHHEMVLLHEADVSLRAFPDCPLAFHQADGDSLRRLEQAVPHLGAGLRSLFTAEAAGLA